MGVYFTSFLVVLLVVAAVLSDSFAFTLLYLFVLSVVAGRWMSRRAIDALAVNRIFTARAHLGEQIPVRLVIENTGWLPVVWLRMHESLPVELGSENVLRRALHLGPKQRVELEYTLHGQRRGVHQVGPLFLYSGDFLGFSSEEKRTFPPDLLRVFPKIVALRRVGLPSRFPLGTLAHRQPVFEDPSRVTGKRDYTSGDSLRRVDWKATASTGIMQVKLFEPSVAVEAAIFLNLDGGDYYARQRHESTELAVVVAASIANWVIENKQSAGLYTNGRVPLLGGSQAEPIPPVKGRQNFTRLLDCLAGVEMVPSGEQNDFLDLIKREAYHLSWGTTMVLITGSAGEALFDVLFNLRRKGMETTLVLVGPIRQWGLVQARARQFGIWLHHVFREQDLDQWRR